MIGVRPGLDESSQFGPKTLFGTCALPLGQSHGFVRSDDLRHLAADRLEKAHHALLERLALSCDFIDQPGRAGVSGAQHLGPQRAQEPARSAEQAHQVGTATESRGDIQPAVHESQRCVRGGNPEIARQRKLGAPADCKPVQRCDHRDGKAPHLLERPMRVGKKLGCILLAAQRGEFAQVAPRGERLGSGAGEHGRLERGIAGMAGKGGGELGEHSAAKRIALVGSIDPHTQQVFGLLDDKMLELCAHFITRQLWARLAHEGSIPAARVQHVEHDAGVEARAYFAAP